jgi:hypothetical protein
MLSCTNLKKTAILTPIRNVVLDIDRVYKCGPLISNFYENMILTIKGITT